MRVICVMLALALAVMAGQPATEPTAVPAVPDRQSNPVAPTQSVVEPGQATEEEPSETPEEPAYQEPTETPEEPAYEEPSQTPEEPVYEEPGDSLVVEPVGPGEVDWTGKTIQATGTSVIDPAKPRGQAYALAVRGAKVDAQRNLLETIKGVRVKAETQVEDLMVKSDYVTTRIDGVIKGAIIVGEPRETPDGMVEVTMEVPMYDAGGIAPPVANQLASRLPVTARAALSQADIRRAQALSGVVFDLTRVNAQPQMFPTIIDVTGDTLLDMAKLYRALGPEGFKRLRYVNGMADILSDRNLMKNPSLINVVSAGEKGWMVAREDTQKVTWVDKTLQILLGVGKTLALAL